MYSRDREEKEGKEVRQMKEGNRSLKLRRQMVAWVVAFVDTVVFKPHWSDWLDWLRANKN